MQGLATKAVMLERGVYETPYLVDGVRALIAIDSRGVARKHIKLRAGVSYDRAKAYLEELLERIDPEPRLELVRDATPATIGVPPRLPRGQTSFDPHDRRAYLRRVARDAWSRVREFDD